MMKHPTIRILLRICSWLFGFNEFNILVPSLQNNIQDFYFLKLFFNFEIWTKINVQFSFFKKSFKILFFIFFRFLF